MRSQLPSNSHIRIIKPNFRQQTTLSDALAGAYAGKSLFAEDKRLRLDTVQPVNTRRMIAFSDGGAVRYSAVAQDKRGQYHFIQLHSYSALVVG